ncbi:MAG: hypothetical protein FWD89_01155 [Firmicutes bacterium]|nr:hypothetical protein [Bacillota bacterium]
MADVWPHLLIAKRFIEKNPGKIADEQAFYDGSLYPDTVNWEEKDITHFGKRGERTDMLKRHLEKVGVEDFLKKHSLDSDFNKGWYLHLITDYEFYNNLIDNDYLKSITDISVFSTDRIYSLRYHTDTLRDKYDTLTILKKSSLEQKQLELLKEWDAADLKRFGKDGPQGKLLYTLEELEAFIERMSDTNI